MVKTGQTWSGLVVCKDSTGALATPSVGPVGALYVDGTANGAAVTISGSNPYKWTVTLPALTAGQCVSMYITATIATIATASVVAEDVADTVRLSDVPAVNVTHHAGVAVAAADLSGNVPVIVKAWYDTLVPEPDTAGYPDVGTVINLSSQVSQQVRNAMKLAASAGAAAAGSVDDKLDDLAADVADGLDELEAALLGGLSGTTVTVVSSVVGGTITVYVADTWRFTVASDQLDLAGYETLGLVVKRSARQADTQALLYLRTDTGLVRMDGAAPVSAANGVLTKGSSSFTAVVHLAETQGLVPGSYTWWLKGLDTTPAPDEAVTLATGEFVVLAAGLQAVV